MINSQQGQELLAIARAAIAGQFDLPRPINNNVVDKSDAWLQEPGACFVTLMQHGELRGCIGSLETRRSLLDDVEANARAAAFSDPRFEPLSKMDLDETLIEISLLSPMQIMQFADESDALAQLHVGIDGVVFEYGFHRSTFLPQVWNQLPTPREFIAHLKTKAGLPADFWSSDVKLQRYSVTKFKESEVF